MSNENVPVHPVADVVMTIKVDPWESFREGNVFRAFPMVRADAIIASRLFSTQKLNVMGPQMLQFDFRMLGA
jgi:hypothetical protein